MAPNGQSVTAWVGMAVALAGLAIGAGCHGASGVRGGAGHEPAKRLTAEGAPGGSRPASVDLIKGRIEAAARRHVDGARASQEPAAPPPPLISNTWVDTDLKQVLTDIASQARVPIVMDPQLQGVVTLTLDRTPLPVALERVTLPLGLVATPFGEGWLVGPADGKSPVYPMLVTTSVYHPKHQRAEELRGLLPDWASAYVKVDGKRNAVIATAPNAIAGRLKQILMALDQRPRQLVIEAIVVDLSRQALDELGISWTGRVPGLEQTGILGVVPEAAKKFAGMAGADVSGATLTWAGPIGSVQLLSKLKALETNSQARIIAAPRILALEGEPASIFIGTEQYFSFQSGPLNFPFITVEKVPAGIELEMLVQMATDEAVLVDVRKAEASTAVPTADNRPLVNRRRASTRVRIPNGGTIAIGGLRQRNDAESYEGIPLLARIPVLGALAGSRRWKTDESELVMFLSASTASTADWGVDAG